MTHKATFAVGCFYADDGGNHHEVTERHNNFVVTRRAGSRDLKTRGLHTDDSGNELAVTSSADAVDTSFVLRARNAVEDKRKSDGAQVPFLPGLSYKAIAEHSATYDGAALQCVGRGEDDGTGVFAHGDAVMVMQIRKGDDGVSEAVCNDGRGYSIKLRADFRAQ